MQLSAVSMESLIPVIRMQLENGGRAPLVVTGISMHPTLRNCRDMVELIPPPETLCRGDLILYRRADGAYVLHRIVTTPRDGKFICSGDNQWEPEDVESDQVIALADIYVRNGKKIPVSAPLCRLWVWLWVGMFPVRKPFIKLRQALGRLRRSLRKKEK